MPEVASATWRNGVAAMNIRPANLDSAVPSIGPDSFRSAMRELSGGVSVITVGIGNDRSGMTATSVSALSLDPPTLIVCVNKTSSTWPLLLRHRSFGVNILHAGHEGVAERFSGRKGETGERRYGDDRWITLETGASLLADALAALDCELEEAIDRHSHAIVIGRVKAIRTGAAEQGLVYWRGRYGGFRSGGA
jgi:flavin reductase (DIM6/NTAB) family NADH-FMN oxidoreductase RutF